jgi:hypothetical protein
MTIMVLSASSAEELTAKLSKYDIVRVINTHVHHDTYKSYCCNYVAFIEVVFYK